VTLMLAVHRSRLPVLYGAELFTLLLRHTWDGHGSVWVLTMHVGVECWNPAFDVTPAALITGGIITEFGVYQPHELKDALTSALTPLW